MRKTICIVTAVQFIKRHGEWREISKQEKRAHSKFIFNFILSEADLNTGGIKPSEKNQATVDLRTEARVTKDEWNRILYKEQQTTESLLNNEENLQEWKKVPIPHQILISIMHPKPQFQQFLVK